MVLLVSGIETLVYTVVLQDFLYDVVEFPSSDT